MTSIRNALSRLVDEVAAAVEPRGPERRRAAPVTLMLRGGRYAFYRNGRRGPALLAGGEIGRLAEDKLPREARAQPVEVRLDADRMVSKVLYLPAASRNYLDAVVSHQLERATPWSADRVVFDFAVLDGAEAGKDQVAVRLVATSREHFDDALDRLAALGVKPAVVGTSDDPLDRASPINLLQATRTHRRDTMRRRVAAALLAIAVIGAAASGWTGWRLHRLNAEAAALGGEIERLRDAVEAARSRSATSESYASLLARKQAAPPLVLLLEELSGAIPTSTYLAQLTLQGEELRLTGFSSDAPALIATLEAADGLADVRFAAPTISPEAGGQDRFEIAARVVPPGDPRPETGTAP